MAAQAPLVVRMSLPDIGCRATNIARAVNWETWVALEPRAYTNLKFPSPSR
jgi:hypothetical protein